MATVPPFATHLLLIVLSSCAPHRTGGARRIEVLTTKPGEQLITAEAIQQSGAATAWDVIQRAAPNIQVRENRNGEPTRMWRRGRGSIVLNEAPLLFLDGVKIADFRALDLIPAGTIREIVILTGIEGTTYYGTNAVGGVILVTTKNGT
jgi:TonB-dependent starch-binding outer membrane protein SusC